MTRRRTFTYSPPLQLDSAARRARLHQWRVVGCRNEGPRKRAFCIGGRRASPAITPTAMLEFVLARIDEHFERHSVRILELERRIMDGQAQVVAALQDLQATMTTTLTDLEAAVAAIPTSGDPQPALDLIAAMKASLTAADATTHAVPPAAPAPADPPVAVDPPAPAAVDLAAPPAADPAV